MKINIKQEQTYYYYIKLNEEEFNAIKTLVGATTGNMLHDLGVEYLDDILEEIYHKMDNIK